MSARLLTRHAAAIAMVSKNPLAMTSRKMVGVGFRPDASAVSLSGQLRCRYSAQAETSSRCRGTQRRAARRCLRSEIGAV